jgi:hypothetical protein
VQSLVQPDTPIGQPLHGLSGCQNCSRRGDAASRGSFDVFARKKTTRNRLEGKTLYAVLARQYWLEGLHESRCLA